MRIVPTHKLPAKGKGHPILSFVVNILWKCRDVTSLSQGVFVTLRLFLLYFFFVENFQGVAALRLSLLFRWWTGLLSLHSWPFVVEFGCDFKDLVTQLWDTSFIVITIYHVTDTPIPDRQQHEEKRHINSSSVFVVAKMWSHFLIFDFLTGRNISCRMVERSFHFCLCGSTSLF